MVNSSGSLRTSRPKRRFKFGAHRFDVFGLVTDLQGTAQVPRAQAAAGAGEHCGCRLLRPYRSCGMLVLTENAAEPVSSTDVKPIELAWFSERLGDRS
jgi:hypothetical protein